MKKKSFSLIPVFLLIQSLIGQSNNLDTLKLLHQFLPEAPPSGLNSDQAGAQTAILGDINGDGFDDWAIGLPSEYVSGNASGKVHVYLGKNMQKSECRADIVITATRDMGIGEHISGAGDVNNDGFDDFIVTVRYLTNNNVTAQGVLLFYGSAVIDGVYDLFFMMEQDIYFGSALAPAGDLNNDGFDDIVIGSPTVIGGKTIGHAYVYYGGSSMDVNADATYNGIVNQYGAVQYASSVAGAGDMNNDGFDDFIIGTHNTAEIYFGGTEVSTTPVMIIDSLQGTGVGTIVSGAGDVNGDGYSDILLGAYIGNKAYIYYGSETPDNIPDIIFSGEFSTYFGWSISAAGDLNNDGFDDVIVGAYDAGPYDNGWAYVYFGAKNMDSIPDVSMEGNVYGDKFGYSVSGNGDMNNDGFSDIVAGAIGNFTSYTKGDDNGHVYLYLGNTAVDDSADAVFTGAAVGDRFGSSVSSTGDYNRDGYPDILIGAPSVAEGVRVIGRTFLFYGGPSSFDTANVIFAGMNNGTDTYFGNPVTAAGDINNDGFQDILIGEKNRANLFFGKQNGFYTESPRKFSQPMEDTRNITALGDINQDGYDDFIMGTTARKTYLYLGKSALYNVEDITYNIGTDTRHKNAAATGDLNTDGYPDFAIGKDGLVGVVFGDSIIDNNVDLFLFEEQAGSEFGLSITGGYDLNGDGVNDLAVGARQYDDDAYTNIEGRVYLYYGGSEMDNTPDVVITGDSVWSNLGSQVLMIPDINQDGYPELLAATGSLLGGNGLIYYGGISMDSEPDIFLKGYFNDFAAFINPDDNTVNIVAGESSNSMAGEYRGSAYIFTNEKLISALNKSGETYKPEKLKLYSNYPNPFNPSTTIRYELPFPEKVTIKIYDISGKKICTLLNSFQNAGYKEMVWNGQNDSHQLLASGLYMLKITTKTYNGEIKMLLLK